MPVYSRSPRGKEVTKEEVREDRRVPVFSGADILLKGLGVMMKSADDREFWEARAEREAELRQQQYQREYYQEEEMEF